MNKELGDCGDGACGSAKKGLRVRWAVLQWQEDLWRESQNVKDWKRPQKIV